MLQELPVARRVVSTTTRIIGLVVLSFVVAVAVTFIPAGDEPQTRASGAPVLLISSAGALPSSEASAVYFHSQFPDRGRAPDAEAAPSF